MPIELTPKRRELLKEINETLRLIQKDDSPQHTEKFRNLSRQYHSEYKQPPISDIHIVREES